MLTGELRSQIDRIWDAFWSGGISNPLEVIEQITYLLFLRRLDDLHTLEENKSTRLKKPMGRRVFPEGNDPKGRPYEDLRWSRFKHFAPGDMYAVVPRMVPSRVREPAESGAAPPAVVNRQSPKSTTLTIPSWVTRMLAGLTSRCTIPAEWAAVSAAAIWIASDRASRRGRGPPAKSDCSGRPVTSSMAMNHESSSANSS